LWLKWIQLIGLDLSNLECVSVVEFGSGVSKTSGTDTRKCGIFLFSNAYKMSHADKGIA
jgi:hypothetical protein